MSDDALDVYDEITGGSRANGTFELSVDDGRAIEWDVTPLPRPDKNDLLTHLPDGYFDPVLDLEELDVSEDELEAMDEEEVMSLLKANDIDLAEATRRMLLDEAATERAIEAIVDSFNHPSLSDEKTKRLLRSPKFPDRAFEDALRTVLEVSSADDDVVEFRSER
jgi:hypothetical protein